MVGLDLCIYLEDIMLKLFFKFYNYFKYYVLKSLFFHDKSTTDFENEDYIRSIKQLINQFIYHNF